MILKLAAPKSLQARVYFDAKPRSLHPFQTRTMPRCCC
jgi:hypothetical protein